MTDAYLAIDFGTSNVHVSLIDATTTRALVATSRKYGWYYPAPNQVELHIEETWQASEQAVGEVISRMPADARLIAITFSYFGDSITPVDEKGEALYSMLPGFCGRSYKEVQTIADELGADTYARITGNTLTTLSRVGKQRLMPLGHRFLQSSLGTGRASLGASGSPLILHLSKLSIMDRMMTLVAKHYRLALPSNHCTFPYGFAIEILQPFHMVNFI